MLALGAIAPAQADYYDMPRDVQVTGPYTQTASGMVFPESVREFKRTDVVSYNSERTDESVSYLLDSGGKKIAVTLYVYPIPVSLGSTLAQMFQPQDLIGIWFMMGEQLFAGEKRTIAELHPGAELLNEDGTSFDQHGISYPGNVATFRYDEDFFGSVEHVRSRLYLFSMVGGDWMVKYRVTYPESVSDGAAQTDAFIHALPWTIRGLQ
jgi:hypothetical protein